MPHLDDEHDPFWPGARAGQLPPPPPPPPHFGRHRVDAAVVESPELVTSEGGAGQVAAACVFQKATIDFVQRASQHRKALEMPPHHANIALFALGSVGAVVRASAARIAVWDLHELVDEALVAVGLPAHLQPIEFIVELPSRLSLQGFEDVVGDAIYSSFERYDPQHLPPHRLGQLLVPRYHGPQQFPNRAAFPQPPATSSWSLPLVHHRLVLRPHPGIPLGAMHVVEFLIPPSGPLAHAVQSPDNYVKLRAAPAHVDLAYQLVRMWSADDRLSPLYTAHNPAVVAVAALNCMVMYEVQAFTAMVNAATGSPMYSSELLSCQLAGFGAFAEELFAPPSPSFAGALVGHHDVFRDWLIRRFGATASRTACAKQCVEVLAPYWPSIRDAPAGEARASRERQVEGLFAQAFHSIHRLAFPQAFPPEQFV